MQYAVLTPAWLVCAQMLPSERRTARWWAAYAGFCALGLGLIVWGMHGQALLPRVLGNVSAVLSMLALQRGIWSFAGQAPWSRTQALLLLITALVSASTLSPPWGPWSIASIASLWGGLYLWCAVDVWRHLRHERARRLRLLCVAPMLAGGALLLLRAVRALVSPETVMQEVLQDSWLSVGSAFGGLVAALVLQLSLVGLLVARMVERMDRLSRHDALTGLLNRRAIDQVIQLEEQRVRRLNGEMSVLMVDIDHFKRINDQWGHAAGDQALQHLAAVMAANLRQIDHLARWGGEEFLVLLPATGADEALVLAERLRECIRQAPLLHNNQRLELTASIGVAPWLGATDSREVLIGRADAALYAAKRAGRNCVRSSTEPSPALAGWSA